MIENHYELNIARDGKHYARVIFPSDLSEDTAKVRANRIWSALTDSSVNDTFACALSRIECQGVDIEI